MEALLEATGRNQVNKEEYLDLYPTRTYDWILYMYVHTVGLFIQ